MFAFLLKNDSDSNLLIYSNCVFMNSFNSVNMQEIGSTLVKNKVLVQKELTKSFVHLVNNNNMMMNVTPSFLVETQD